MVSCTFYSNLPILSRRYICHECDILRLQLQLWITEESKKSLWGNQLTHSRSLFYFVPQDSHSQAGLTSITQRWSKKPRLAHESRRRSLLGQQAHTNSLQIHTTCTSHRVHIAHRTSHRVHIARLAHLRIHPSTHPGKVHPPLHWGLHLADEDYHDEC